MSIRVLIADDHPVFRSGLKALLEKEADLQVVAETGSGDETINAVRDREIDVLILDISMPGMSGSRVADILLRERPDLAIVVLTMHEEEHYLHELLDIGVCAFVLKKSTATDLVQAIRAAHRGDQYVDPSLTGHVITSYVKRRSQRPKPGRVELLSPREQEVGRLLAYGHTNAEIARQLAISERTVESHRMHIMRKLNLKSRAELVRFAIDHGLLKLE
jgi:two-component system response regulator NreC